MKRTTKSVTAFVLVLLLIAAFPAAAFATNSTGQITGGSTVENVTLEVLVPSSLAFALDPLGLDVTGENQISTQDFYFVNQTFAPVKVSVDITAETSGGAVLVSTTSGLSLNDTNETDKELYFGALGATDITGGSIDVTATGGAFDVGTGPAAYYDSASDSSITLVPFTPNSDGTTGSAVISFALDAATESSSTPGAIASLAANNDGIAAFQFFSQLNTYAGWEANDITVSGTYTLTPLRDTTYTGYDYVTNSLNQLVPEVVTPSGPPAPYGGLAGFIVSSNTTATTLTDPVTISKAGQTTNYSIPFYFDGKTVQSLTMNGTYTCIDTTDFTVSGNNLVIVKTSAGSGSTHVFDKATAGTKTMVLRLTGDSTSYTFTINLTT